VVFQSDERIRELQAEIIALPTPKQQNRERNEQRKKQAVTKRPLKPKQVIVPKTEVQSSP
jgi:hypothetical protein